MLLLLIMAGVIWVINLIWYKPFSVDMFYERMFIEYGLEDPELMSRLELDKRYGIYFLNDKLTDISTEKAQKRYNDIVDRNLVMLNSYKETEQTEEQLLSSDILNWYLENEVLKFHATNQDYLTNHIDGIQIALPRFMIEVHQINRLSDADDYLSRLSAFAHKFDQLIVLLQEREQNGVLAPRFVIDNVIIQLELFLNTKIKYNILYRDFIYKVTKAPQIRSNALRELRSEAKSIIEDEVYPAYRKLLAFLKEQRERANNDNIGAASLPTGQLYYLSMRRTHTTIDLDAHEIHEIGLEQVKLIETKLHKIFDTLGVSMQQNIGTRIKSFAKQETFYYPNNREGRTQCIEDYQKLVNKFKPFLHELSLYYPKDSIVVKQLPVFREAVSPLLSYQPPQHLNEPAIFYANLKDMRDIPTYKMPIIVLHELLGDYVQHWYEFKLEHVPTFRKELRFDVFIKGWALYAEQFAEEHAYLKDNYAKVGKLQNELFIAALLVVDTGIHEKQWNRKTAINYLVKTTGLTQKQAQKEVDRCVVKPGRACLYMLGKLEFIKLRQRLEQELKGDFDEKIFHDFVLRHGNMPMPVLKRQVSKYIKQRTKSEKKDNTFFD